MRFRGRVVSPLFSCLDLPDRQAVIAVRISFRVAHRLSICLFHLVGGSARDRRNGLGGEMPTRAGRSSLPGGDGGANAPAAGSQEENRGTPPGVPAQGSWSRAPSARQVAPAMIIAFCRAPSQ